MFYKLINDLMYKQSLKNLNGYEKVLWGDDPEDDRFLWYITNTAAYRIPKEYVYVLLRDEPTKEESMKSITTPDADARTLTRTGNERSVDKRTLIEFEFDDGEKMYINKDLLKPFDKAKSIANLRYEAKNGISKMFVMHGDAVLGLVLPVRV